MSQVIQLLSKNKIKNYSQEDVRLPQKHLRQIKKGFFEPKVLCRI